MGNAESCQCVGQAMPLPVLHLVPAGGVYRKYPVNLIHLTVLIRKVLRADYKCPH